MGKQKLRRTWNKVKTVKFFEPALKLMCEGLALFFQQKFEAALRCFQKVRGTKVGHVREVELLHFSIRSYIHLGDKTRAMLLLKKLKYHGRDYPAIATIVRNMKDKGKSEVSSKAR